MKQKHIDVYKKLKFNICYERKMKKLTQNQLAEKIEISNTHMSNIEAPNSVVLPSLDVLIDISNALDIKLAKLFDFKD
jgi:Predicted transcriptional regulators